jgi:hypothetical protein
MQRSLFREANSLLASKKFPAPTCREFPVSYGIRWPNSTETRRRGPKSANFPAEFPASREFDAETGAIMTASSASQSRLRGVVAGSVRSTNISAG